MRGTCRLLIASWLLVAAAATAQNGIIRAQDLDASDRGYTFIRVWGSPHEMGYAQANLLGDYIVDAVDQIEQITGGYYSALRGVVALSVEAPTRDPLFGREASLYDTVRCFSPSPGAAWITSLRDPTRASVEGRPSQLGDRMRADRKTRRAQWPSSSR